MIFACGSRRRGSAHVLDDHNRRRSAEIKRAEIRISQTLRWTVHGPRRNKGAISFWAAAQGQRRGAGEQVIGLQMPLSMLNASRKLRGNRGYQARETSNPMSHNGPFPDSSSMSRCTYHLAARSNSLGIEPDLRDLPPCSCLAPDSAPRIRWTSQPRLHDPRARVRPWAREPARKPVTTAI